MRVRSHSAALRALDLGQEALADGVSRIEGNLPTTGKGGEREYLSEGHDSDRTRAHSSISGSGFSRVHSASAYTEPPKNQTA
jgi:hypothetical protein